MTDPRGPNLPKSPRARLSARAAALAVGLVVLTATAGTAHAQQSSRVAGVALTAHAAPGVRTDARGLGADTSAAAGELGLGAMAVNTAYRVELHRSGEATLVVLLRRDGAGVVPWDLVRARLSLATAVTGRAEEPIILDLVVRPSL